MGFGPCYSGLDPMDTRKKVLGNIYMGVPFWRVGYPDDAKGGEQKFS